MFPHKLHLNYEEKSGTLQQINLVNTTFIKVNMNLPTNTGANPRHLPLNMLPYDGHINPVYSPKTQAVNLTMKKNQTNPTWEVFYKITGLKSEIWLGHKNKEKAKEQFHTEQDWRACHVGTWTGPQPGENGF